MNFIDFVYQYSVEGYITFSVNVTSGPFSGESNFCVATELLEKGIYELQNVYKLLAGTYTLNDYDSDDFFAFEMQQHGHMIVRGQVGGSHNSQYLVYEFQSDQTALKKIIDNLSRLLKT